MRKNIIKFAKIDSTQNYAKKIAEKSPSGTIVVAQKQTQGRGRFERKWSSQKGGLYFSIILKPHIDIKRYPDKIPELTLKMAAAIIDALKIEKPKIFILTSEEQNESKFSFCPNAVKTKGLIPFIKPPNDVMVRMRDEGRGTKYKKIAGILTESSISDNKIDWLVIGVGVNINNKIPKDLKKIAVSLKEITKKKENIKKIFNEIIKRCESLVGFVADPSGSDVKTRCIPRF